MESLTHPQYVRPSDMRHYFGISRSIAYELIKDKKIKSVVMRKRGRVRGVRLILCKSVAEYLESLEVSDS